MEFLHKYPCHVFRFFTDCIGWWDRKCLHCKTNEVKTN